MLKKILIGLAILLLVAVAGFYIYVNSGEKLPDNTNEVVKEVLANNDLPEFVTGTTGFAKNDDVDIWYEVMGQADSSKATILLVMGHSATAMIWSTDFYQAFIDSGYQVIRYDNRGLGESSWIEDWSKENAYSLEDMAKDGIAVLDAVGVEKAHVIGVSMGGMISQRMAISHGDRLLSLTSIMSSANMNDESIPFPNEFTVKMTKLALKYMVINPSEANIMKFGVGFQQLLRGDGPYELNVKRTAQKTLYEIRNRKGLNTKVGDQHTAAIFNSGSRIEELTNISVPTLVIHGKSDPLVKFEHGQKYAPLIPNADTLFVEGMGHDLPKIYTERYHEAIFRNFDKVK